MIEYLKSLFNKNITGQDWNTDFRNLSILISKQEWQNIKQLPPIQFRQ